MKAIIKLSCDISREEVKKTFTMSMYAMMLHSFEVGTAGIAPVLEIIFVRNGTGSDRITDNEEKNIGSIK